MPRNDSGCGRRGTDTRTGLGLDRRSWLKATGVAVGSAALFSGAASAATERGGIRFKRTVNMVDDAGCDPTGEEPCDEQLRAAADDYTLLVFPEGTYTLTEKNVVLDATNVGFLGKGDVRFTVPEGFNEKALVVDRGRGVLFENIDIDQRAHGATPGLHLGADDDLVVRDVEFIGQGIAYNSEPRGAGGNPSVTNAFTPIVRSSSGTGVVSNVVARNAGLLGAYNGGNGRVGVWIGLSNRGTITLEDCHIEGFPNNGLYCSRTYGVVRVEGGTFRNNDISQVRIGSEGSYVAGATIEVDAAASDSPNPDAMLNGRGVRLEVGALDTAGPAVRDCDIVIADAPHSGGGVVASGDIGRFDVSKTRIKVDADGVRGVLAKDPTGGAYDTGGPYDGTLRGVSVTGSANGTSAIELRQRSGSVIENCCIHTGGDGRDGVTIVDSHGCVLRDGTIDVAGEAIVRENATLAVDDIADSGSCPVPDGSPHSQPPSPSESDGDANVLTIEGAPGADYELAASEGLEKRTAMDATIDPNDDLDGATATGQVGGHGRDSYAISGEITRLVLDGGANLYYNGEDVDPAEYLPNTLTIESPTHADYAFTTTDGVAKSSVMGAADPNDTIDGRSVSGQVGEGGKDSFAYLGEIESLDIDGDATVYRNGNEIDPDRFGSDDSDGSDGSDVLTIEGAPGADYELAASEGLEKRTAMDATIDSNDTIDGATATGQVGGHGRDSYAISGTITRLVLDGGANLYYNGESIDPAEYLPNTLTIESETHADYTFSTSDGVAKSAAMGAADPNDTIDGRSVSGQVGEGGKDSFAYPGTIESLDVDDDATIYRNGNEIDPDRFESGDSNDGAVNILTIEGAPGADYELAASEGLEKRTAMDATIDPNDDLDGATATGQVGGQGRDSYAISGEITRLVLDGGANLYYNGEDVDPAEYLPNTLTIESETHADYAFSTSDGVAKSAAMGAADPNDTIDGRSVSGQVGEGGKDSFAYPGTIESLDIDGDATVYRNGTVLTNPARAARTPDSLPTFGRLP